MAGGAQVRLSAMAGGRAGLAPGALALLVLLASSLSPGAQARRMLPLLEPLAQPSDAASPQDGAGAGGEDPCWVLQGELQSSIQAQNASFPSDYIPYAVARPLQVLPCSQSLEFNASRELGTLASVIADFQSFYPSLEVARQSPDPLLPSAYDVVAQLQALEGGNWSTAEDFYSAVSSAINGLNDGHTRFEPACPPFVHWLALTFVAARDNGEPSVYTAPASLLVPLQVNASIAVLGFDPRDYAGVKVALIEGQPAWQFMVGWAEANAGVFHTQGQRLNWAFASLSATTVSWGAFGLRRSANPRTDYVHATLLRAGGAYENVSIPFLSLIPSYFVDGFSNASDYYQTFCAPYPYYPSASVSSQGPGAEAGHSLRGLVPQLMQQSPQSSIGATLPSGQHLEVALTLAMMPGLPQAFQLHRSSLPSPYAAAGTLVSGPYDLWQVYKLSDSQTSVLVIDTFAPPLPFRGGALEYFIVNTQKAFFLANQNSSRVIIDLSNNGGGYVEFAGWLAELIVGSAAYPKKPSVQNPLDWPANTDVVLAMRKASAGNYNWNQWNDVAEEPYTDANQDQFFYPVTELSFGDKGFPGNYSSLFKLPGPALSELYYPFPPAFGDKPFFLFSNGFCFSSCAIFAVNLHAQFGVPLVDIGGISPAPMAFSAGAVGFVTFSANDDFLFTAPPDVRALPDAPKPFGIYANLAMSITNRFFQEGNSANYSSPMEWYFVPAALQLNYSLANVEDFTVQWQQAAQAYWGP